MKKKLVLGMAGVMAFTTLLGTNVVIGNADEDKVEITYTSRGNADEIKVYQQAVDAFNEAQDKIHVTFEATPSDGYSQQLITQLAGGTAADVIFVEDTVMSQLAKNGTIANMKDFLATDDSYVKEEDFGEGVWGAARNDEGVMVCL